MKRILLLICIVLNAVTQVAAMGNDTIISLVTINPGSEIYELEGHQILRIKTPVFDDAISYGTFDFNSPNFVYRFLKGETDYCVSSTPFPVVESYYRYYGRGITEHVLDLNNDEKRLVLKLLKENFKPENVTYRYNYVKDNCATRPLAIVNSALKIAGNDSIALILAPTDVDEFEQPTFRSMMRYYHTNYPWYQFGIDLALGNGIDKPIDVNEMIFAPEYLNRVLPLSHRVSSGKSIVQSTNNLYQTDTYAAILPSTPWYLHPVFVFAIVFLIAAVLTFRRNKAEKILQWFDFIFYIAMSVTCMILYFLAFISVHEATWPNYLVLVFNPLCFVPVVFAFSKRFYRFKRICQICNITLVILGVVLCITFGQYINPAVFFIIVTDILRASSQILKK